MPQGALLGFRRIEAPSSTALLVRMNKVPLARICPRSRLPIVLSSLTHWLCVQWLFIRSWQLLRMN